MRVYVVMRSIFNNGRAKEFRDYCDINCNKVFYSFSEAFEYVKTQVQEHLSKFGEYCDTYGIDTFENPIKRTTNQRSEYYWDEVRLLTDEVHISYSYSIRGYDVI